MERLFHCVSYKEQRNFITSHSLSEGMRSERAEEYSFVEDLAIVIDWIKTLNSLKTIIGFIHSMRYNGMV